MTIVCLPGDGIGPEVMEEAKRVFAALAPDVELEEHPFGAQAIRDSGDPLPEGTLAACQAAQSGLRQVGLPVIERDRRAVAHEGPDVVEVDGAERHERLVGLTDERLSHPTRR